MLAVSKSTQLWLCLLMCAVGKGTACTVARAKLGGSIQWGVVHIVAPSDEEMSRGGLGAGSFAPLGQGWLTTRSFITEGGLQQARQQCAQPTEGTKSVSLSDVELLPPLTDDGQRMMLGLNYRQHAQEAGVSAEEANEFIMMFPKMSLPTAYDADVLRPPHVKFLDYEVELGVVLAKDAQNAIVTDENVDEFVAGVVLVHDFTGRAEQLHQQQWVKGKGYRTFGPVGPFLHVFAKGGVAEGLKNIQLKLWVNGELRQNASTGDLIHGVPKVITEMSHTFDYRAGDAIWTGTPSGVIVGRNSVGEPVSMSPLVRTLGQMIFGDSLFKFMFQKGGIMHNKKWLQEGDVVTAAATGADLFLGVTRNVIKQDNSWLYREQNVLDTALPWRVPLTFLGILLCELLLGIILGCVCRRSRRKAKVA